MRQVTLAPAAARQLADSVEGGLEAYYYYYWMFGQCHDTAVVSLADSQAARLPRRP